MGLFGGVCERCVSPSCQFVVSDRGDYRVHSADPDLLVDWDCIELVVSTLLSSSSLLSLCIYYGIVCNFSATVLPRNSILPHLPLPSQSRY